MDATASWQVPRLRHENRILLGVAGGIADEIGVDAVVVRSGFVLLAVAGGWGVLFYLGAYALMARAAHQHPDETYVAVPKGSRSSDRVLGVLLAVVGLVLLIEALGGGFRSSIAWPTALVGLGALVVWYRGRGDSFVPTADGGSAATRIGAGLVLVGAGIVGLFALNIDVTAARDGLLLGTAVVAGLALVVAPSISRLVRDLAEERRRRVRSEERARVAAHLHDSVLQTLALIQRNVDDPAQMTALARRQERELREWLYGGSAISAAGTLRAELQAACDEVEELHRVPIELVVVGDVLADERMREVVDATREALVNASRHAGTPRIDVYAEATPETLEVYVRDQGRGFDSASVPSDRRGVRESIVARMERCGGAATILSSPGGGTEIELLLPLGAAPGRGSA